MTWNIVRDSVADPDGGPTRRTAARSPRVWMRLAALRVRHSRSLATDGRRATPPENAKPSVGHALPRCMRYVHGQGPRARCDRIRRRQRLPGNEL